MDDVYHGYQCGDDCPQCHPEVRQTYLERRRWRVWEVFPGWEFCAEPCGKGVRLLVRPENEILTGADEAV